MLSLDSFLPEYSTVERHAIEIHAAPEEAYRALLGVDFNRSKVISVLFSLRGLGRFTRGAGAERSPAMRLEDFTRNGFILLQDAPGRELILGLIGRFWTPTGGLLQVAADDFLTAAAPGQAKAVWGFEFQALAPGATRLVTETRVWIPDPTSRRRFGLYWQLIGPFSGWIRQELLRLVKMEAEK